MILAEWTPGVPRPQGNPQQITARFSRYPKPTIEHRNEVIRHLGLIWDGKPPQIKATYLQRRHYAEGAVDVLRKVMVVADGRMETLG